MNLQVSNYKLEQSGSFHDTWAGKNREINDGFGKIIMQENLSHCY